MEWNAKLRASLHNEHSTVRSIDHRTWTHCAYTIPTHRDPFVCVAVIISRHRRQTTIHSSSAAQSDVCCACELFYVFNNNLLTDFTNVICVAGEPHNEIVIQPLPPPQPQHTHRSRRVNVNGHRNTKTTKYRKTWNGKKRNSKSRSNWNRQQVKWIRNERLHKLYSES